MKRMISRCCGIDAELQRETTPEKKRCEAA